MTQTYTVIGMSCSHCASSVREEVSAVASVRNVDIDLQTGRLVVVGDGFADDAVASAVHGAGYQLAS